MLFLFLYIIYLVLENSGIFFYMKINKIVFEFLNFQNFFVCKLSKNGSFAFDSSIVRTKVVYKGYIFQMSFVPISL